MNWNYAELSSKAKIAGGPEKLLNGTFNEGMGTGLLLTGLSGLVGTLAGLAVCNWLDRKDRRHSAELEVERWPESQQHINGCSCGHTCRHHCQHHGNGECECAHMQLSEDDDLSDLLSF